MNIELSKINQKIIDEIWIFGNGGGDIYKTRGPVVQYKKSNQYFCVDKSLAYDVTPREFTDNDGSFHRFIPVVIGGSTFHSHPDEGRCGILTIHEFRDWPRATLGGRCNPSGYRLFWGTELWIYTSELDLSPKQIRQTT